jgi:hypothetical protein
MSKLLTTAATAALLVGKHDEGKPVLIADRRVAERYDVSVRTLARWDKTPGLGFPPPVYIRDRRYRELAKLEKWDRANARKAAMQGRPRGHSGRFVKGRRKDVTAQPAQAESRDSARRFVGGAAAITKPTRNGPAGLDPPGRRDGENYHGR